MISVVIVYNENEITNSLIYNSLVLQSSEYELILVNNENNRNFTSAAAALNCGASKAKCKYFMFVHQDVELLERDFLEKAEQFLVNDPTILVAGVAGMSEFGKNYKDSCKNLIFHGYPDKRSWGNKIEIPENVQTLDECLFLVPREYFLKNPFDEKTCPNWHLYGVDYCLNAKMQNGRVVALPLAIYHKSSGESARPKIRLFGLGSINYDYYRSLKKVLKKYRGKIPRIITTCGMWRTSPPLFFQRVCSFCRRMVKTLFGS